MPLKVIRYEPTPNPDALKCILSGSVSPGSRSFRTRDQAAGEPLAAAIMGLEGVGGLLLCGDWLTINRVAGSPWGPIKAGLEKALGAP
jgi:hypothetical protein